MYNNMPLKQVLKYELRICDLSQQVMMAGDWYYEAPDGKIYLYEAFHTHRQRIKDTMFDTRKLHKAASSADYKRMLKQYEQQVIQQQVNDFFINKNNTDKKDV